MKSMIVVLGHGSRAAEHNQGLMQVVEMVRSKTDLPVTAAFMENCRPNVDTVIRGAAAEGYQRFIVMPLFLFRGIHVQQDVPKEIVDIKRDLPELEVIFTGHLGPDPKIAEIVWDRVREVI
ncbi:MAG TPA: CbiX/SirB N-terminal domain-containing protein [Desulfobacteria bacterium]|nr:CbiX/SirB N-terminal domain-containing protein [Desulfobacteria bacterium]